MAAKKTTKVVKTKATTKSVVKTAGATKKHIPPTTKQTRKASDPKPQPAMTKVKAAAKAPRIDDVESRVPIASAPPLASARGSRKRKAAVADDVRARESKKARVSMPHGIKSKPKIVINKAPITRLNVYVCGEGSSGELGLGTARNAVDVKRPRLNPLLGADTVGVVQIAAGGMHCIALTHDNKILTWGVNDQGALGRDTTWEGDMKDIDDDDSDSSSDDGSESGLNPLEATPTAIPSDAFPEGTVFVEVAAGDSGSFALTEDGLVYGWGTFRGNDGVLGFDASHEIQAAPVLIPALRKIKHLACGDNHVLALNEKGAVFAWGSGQQNQLGRRIIERNKLNGLQPREFGLPKDIVHIGCGAFHSFAVHKSGKVYGWGLNSFGETGIPKGAGDNEAAILHPSVIKSLENKDVIQLCGGSHHSIALTSQGECLVWGRLDGFQTGLKIDSLPDSSVIKDDRGRARILVAPTAIPGISARYIAAGTDHSIAIGNDGRAWSWGFSANYQTGQGTDDDIEVATIVENTAVRGKMLNGAWAGGQFSIFTEPVISA